MKMAPLLLLVLVVPGGFAAEVLGLFYAFGRSQWVLHETYLRALQQRGHHITVVTNFPSSPASDATNWTEILIPPAVSTEDDINAFKEFSTGSSFELAKACLNFGESVCHNFLKDENVHKLYRSRKKFDVIVLESAYTECVHGYAYMFKAPIVVTSSFAGTNWMGDMVGNPNPYAYLPSPYLPYTAHMNFLERMHNVILGVSSNIARQLIYLPRLEAIMRKYIKDADLPRLSDVEMDVSLVLINYHFTHGCARPLVPNMVEVGGLHVRRPKKLPQDIQKFLDEAKDGVIFFSMGSNVQSAHWTEEKRSAFLSVFSKLKQRILWKWERDVLPGQPPNVRIGKWLPQSDILAHKNVRAFITHGGLLSIQEATARGVPLVGIPVFGDQQMNMAQAEMQGYAVKLDISNITRVSLQWALDQVLNVPRYRENAQRLSRIFNDRPMAPLDEAVYWTEYVVRHKGAPHLRSAALDLTWYQYFLLDVIAFVLAVAALIIAAACVAIKAVLQLLCRLKAAPHDERSSKKKD